jgi:hypothetical protein
LTPFLIGAGILALLAAFFVVQALRGRTLRAAPGLFGVGLAAAALHLRIGGIDLLSDAAGYGLAALGAGLAARSAQGLLPWICPTALALAGVFGLLGFPALSAVAAALGIAAVPALASAVGGPPVLTGRILRSAFFAFYVGYAVFVHGWALAGLASGRENAFRIDGSPAVATVMILSAALVWAILHLRGAVRRRLQAA